MIATFPQSASHSSMLWLLSTTEWRCCSSSMTSDAIMSHKTLRAPGSIPVEGSSRRTMLGSPTFDENKAIMGYSQQRYARKSLASIFILCRGKIYYNNKNLESVTSATATASFLRFPPEYVLHKRSESTRGRLIWFKSSLEMIDDIDQGTPRSLGWSLRCQ